MKMHTIQGMYTYVYVEHEEITCSTAVKCLCGMNIFSHRFFGLKRFIFLSCWCIVRYSYNSTHSFIEFY